MVIQTDQDELLVKHRCEDNNADLICVQPHDYCMGKVEPYHQLSKVVSHSI